MKVSNLLVLLSIPVILVSSNLSSNIIHPEARVIPKESSTKEKITFKEFANQIYLKAGLKESNLKPEVFYKALQGFMNMKKENLVKKDVLAVIDFALPSTEKRLWIIDIENKAQLEHTFVAHGKNSGNNMAVKFSNKSKSNMSSLGFYVADETYIGKHGLSLRLKGMDEGYNTNAYSRAVVLHGAEYVCEDFIKQNGRLGRSFGCPAVPRDKEKKIIEILKDGAALFIHHPAAAYSSKFLQAAPDIK